MLNEQSLFHLMDQNIGCETSDVEASFYITLLEDEYPDSTNVSELYSSSGPCSLIIRELDHLGSWTNNFGAASSFPSALQVEQVYKISAEFFGHMVAEDGTEKTITNGRVICRVSI